MPRPVIRELSKSMINKIAAGEVVERPANVVKELVENSIDAGAKRVVVEVENGGQALIKISDDGCGIAADQMVLALSPHSTSKLSEPDDLFKIHTLGFRGEALASIAEITHLTLSSRADGAAEGARICCDGGNRGEVCPIGRAQGTTIEARDLFFNVPARRKFLKSPAAEFGHIQEAIIRLAIPNTNVAFVLKHNGRMIYDLPSSEGELDRLRRLFRDEVASRLVPVESSFRDVRVYGYVGKPELYRSSTKMQYLFLNKRCIQDRALSHAIKEAYRGLIPNGNMSQRNPVVFLNVTVPPNFVDVNVHPTKMEVRFVDSQGIYASLLTSIRDLFLRTDLVNRPNAAELSDAANKSRPINERHEEQEREIRFVPDVDPRDHMAALDERVLEASRQSVLDMFRKKSNASESVSAPSVSVGSSSLLDQSRLDVEAANDALAEAAFLDAEERRKAENARETAPRTNDFRKFPDLHGEKSEPAKKTTPIKLRPFEHKTPVDDLTVPSTALESASIPSAERTCGSERVSAPTELEPTQDNAQDAAEPPTPERAPSADDASAPISNSAPISTSAPVSNSTPISTSAPVSNSSQISTSAPLSATTPASVSARMEPPRESTLLAQVTAHNAEFLSTPGPLSKRVAYNSQGKPVVQMCDRYLVMETNDGIAIVDQHALHERILFERVKANMESGKLDSQRLLVPKIVDLSPTERPLALENKELFETLGVSFDEFGGSSVAVNSYPAVMRGLSPGEIFTTILEAIDRRKGKVERADLLDFVLKQTACKAAIKAGEYMTPEGVIQLVAEAEKEINFHHCPHGRPSTIVLTCKEIDKLFKR